jgi:hypothetical protein
MEVVMAKANPNQARNPAPNPAPAAQPPASAERKGGCLSIIIRLGWIFGGIAVLIYCAVFVAMGKYPGTADLLYWIIVAAILLLRFVDIKFLNGETLDNKPATINHWRIYALKISVASGILYALAKFVAYKKLI